MALVKVEKNGEIKEIQSEDLSFFVRRLGYTEVKDETPKKKGKKVSEMTEEKEE